LKQEYIVSDQGWVQRIFILEDLILCFFRVCNGRFQSPWAVTGSPLKDGPMPKNSSFTILLFVCCHFAYKYEWNFLYLFSRDETPCLLWVLKISNFFLKIWNYREFLRKNEENWYQIQNVLKKYENFILGVFFSVEIHGIKQSYHNILKLGNQQTMVTNLKFI